jgi:hypothetical protein
MSAIFGDDGLVSADDTFNFKAKSLQVKEVAENYKQWVRRRYQIRCFREVLTLSCQYYALILHTGERKRLYKPDTRHLYGEA